MLDPPQPTYGRFTVPPAELQPRDASDWLEDAEDAIRHAHNQSLPQRRRRGPLERSPISHGTHLTTAGWRFRAPTFATG